jgi:(1->4)-alpha-D-glucan 1-alpha-D-glucosylmutase
MAMGEVAPSGEIIDVRSCALHMVQRLPRFPAATYRLQFNKDFKFADAAALADYLTRLGISDVYASPIFEARPGSTHGYDVVEQNKLSTDCGGEPEFLQMSAALRANGLGLLIDIVPNHMGVGNRTPWWQDVLENGHASEFADFFDIDWHPLKAAMDNKLLLPILGGPYGGELESGKLHLCFEDCAFRICYFDHRLPVAAPTLRLIFQGAVELPADFRSALEELEHVPPHSVADPGLASQRREQLGRIKPRLEKMLCSDAMRAQVARALERMRGEPGNSASFERLHKLLEAQPYRLAHWRVSGEEINYRRFFDVNDLAGLRMENPRVFAETNRLIRWLIAEGHAQGLRIDHCDGMFDPRQYLIRLQKLVAAARCCGAETTGEIATNGIETSVREALANVSWSPSRTAIFTLVEKILEPHEALPDSWPVHGTTGYDFIHQVNHLFIAQKNERELTKLYRHFYDINASAWDVVYEKKLLVMDTALANEVYVLTNLLSAIAASDWHARDYTTKVLVSVIRATIAAMPVYRTYIDDRGQYSDSDKAYIREAILHAKRRNQGVPAQAFDFLSDTLLLQSRDGSPVTDAFQRKQLYFALKFQQLSGPVMAKGVEDTAFYVYNRFVSANEVGGSLTAFGMSTAEFHELNRERRERFPHTMIASSTHDTKRGEDVRARLDVLSEMPRQWSSAVRGWQRASRKFKKQLEDGRVVPDGNEEYLLYQTIAGTWPWDINAPGERERYVQRMQQYMAKACAEAKINLSWINPDAAYSEAMNEFIAEILAERRERFTFAALAQDFLPRVQFFGAMNSLAQLLLKVTSPGIPDFYQGVEVWDFSLVDPDNRRPVDYEMRRGMLEELATRSERAHEAGELCRELRENFEDGRMKMWVTMRALSVRREHPDLFTRGEYIPLAASEREEHVVAFARKSNGSAEAITIVPRFAWTQMRGEQNWPIGGVWDDVEVALPGGMHGEWRNVFSGGHVTAATGKIRMADAMKDFPVALLVPAN